MIVIAGDSYSRAHDKSFMTAPRYSWAGNMIRTHGGHGLGVPGSNNLDILERLIPYKHFKCPFIINFSHLVRVSHKVALSKYSTAVTRKRNLVAAEKIIDLFKDRALFWTPFPGYEKISEIESIILPNDDEMWMNRDEQGVLRGFTQSERKQELGIEGNHFTRRGNDLLFERFSAWVTSHPLYKQSDIQLFVADNYNSESEQRAWTNLEDY